MSGIPRSWLRDIAPREPPEELGPRAFMPKPREEDIDADYEVEEERPKKKLGHWSKLRNPVNEYHRAAVFRDVPQFIGWGVLKELIELCKTTDYYADGGVLKDYEDLDALRDHLKFRDMALISALFLLGSRVTEAIQLQRKNFDLTDDERIRVTGALLLKRFKCIELSPPEIVKSKDRPRVPGRPFTWSADLGAWTRKRIRTEPLYNIRADFEFPRSEKPFADLLTMWIEDEAPKPEDYIFKSNYRARRGKGTPYISRGLALHIVKNLGLRLKPPQHLWVHWLRSQRASQLASEHGATERRLNRFFGWTPNSVMSQKYAQMSLEEMRDMFGTKLRTIE